MSLVHNSDFLQSEKIIGISVGKSAPDQLHNKLLINFNDVQGELHLEFHHTLTFSETFEHPEMYIWDIPSTIPESRLKSLAARCIKVIKNLDYQDIPYAIEYKGRRKFDKEGIYNSYSTGDEYGVTCATFILTLFDSVGINLLDWHNWEERLEDKVWFSKLIRLIEYHRYRGDLEMSEDHLNNLKSEENCKKIRPEEVFVSAYCNDLPMKFLCSSTMGTNIRNYLIGLS